MSTNRNLLREAIADAKTVKETAIANAKAVLEESFAPQMKSLISLKLQEMAEEDEKEDLEEVGFEKPKAALDEDDENLDEYLDLNELFGELNENEDEEVETEETEETEESEEDEGEPIDLEDFTDEDLKDMIEDVVREMMKEKEIELTDEFEGNQPEEETKETEEEDINLEELLREIDAMDDMEEGLTEIDDPEMEYELDEATAFGNFGRKLLDKIVTAVNRLGSSGQVEDLMKDIPNKIIAFRKLGKLDDNYFPSDAEIAELAKQAKADAGLGAWHPKDGKIIYIPSGKLQGSAQNSTFGENLRSELDEAYATIAILRQDLNEVNLLNAKLLYTNKIFKSKNLNENQKVKVLSSFDKATTVGEVKLVFETLNEGLKVKATKLNENLGSASKVLNAPKKQPIVESNDMVARFQKLAGII